jgi:hypothetical protein
LRTFSFLACLNKSIAKLASEVGRRMEKKMAARSEHPPAYPCLAPCFTCTPTKKTAKEETSLRTFASPVKTNYKCTELKIKVRFSTFCMGKRTACAKMYLYLACRLMIWGTSSFSKTISIIALFITTKQQQ